MIRAIGALRQRRSFGYPFLLQRRVGLAQAALGIRRTFASSATTVRYLTSGVEKAQLSKTRKDRN